MKVSKGAKIRNQYNQVPHLTQDTNKFSLVTMLTLDGFGRPSETISVTP